MSTHCCFTAGMCCSSWSTPPAASTSWASRRDRARLRHVRGEVPVTGWYVQIHPYPSASTTGYGARSWLSRTSHQAGQRSDTAIATTRPTIMPTVEARDQRRLKPQYKVLEPHRHYLHSGFSVRPVLRDDRVEARLAGSVSFVVAFKHGRLQHIYTNVRLCTRWLDAGRVLVVEDDHIDEYPVS